jgi:hypothetical protein
MRRLLPVLALLALAFPSTSAAAPTVTIQASALRGAAPLQVTLTASGDAASYHWDLGDGTAADGAVVQHAYQRGGAYRVVVTATALDGETSEAAVTISALAVTLIAPRVGTYDRRAVFRGRILPAGKGAPVALRQGGVVVAHARTKASGRFRVRARLRSQAPFDAVYEDAVSAAKAVVLRPVIRASLLGSGLAGRPLVLAARVVPAAAAGALRVRVFRGGSERVDRTFTGRARLPLDTRAGRLFEIRLSTSAANGFATARRSLRVLVRVPRLALGARGPSVRLLQQRLLELRFALPGVNGSYDYRTYEAVIAVQKLLWLPRTGRVTPALWSRLQTIAIPHPRYLGGTHIEVDKSRQLLFDVVGGSLRRVIQVSTGATGNTPLGVWHVYSKVPGYNALSMYYSMFFLRGFAVHGYPSVPPYPASHGCVRMPIWIAPTLYAEHAYGTTIYIY